MNAKEEFIKHITGKEVAFVSIAFHEYYTYDLIIVKGKLEEVLPLLDFYCDNSFGGQDLFGYIWYTDGTWSERGEYDGSEWWEYKKSPEQDIDIIKTFNLD